MRKRTPGELFIEEEEKQIILSMHGKKYIGWHEDEDGEVIDEFDDNQIEISYREDDEYGWGVGGYEYFSTSDIKAMADCIRSVIQMKQTRAEYFCQDDIFKLCVEYDSDNERFSFTVALIETLMREYHITITKTNLARAALDEYIQPFFEWENEYPICK